MHIHTLASDGLLSPETVVNSACRAGLNLIAVTDHDTVFNTEKVNTLCQNAGITGICGIEISAYLYDTKIHILGYGFDIYNQKFNDFLNNLYTGSLNRTEYVIKKLNACGVRLSFDEAAAERVSDKTPIHTMHIARAAVKNGYAENPFAFYKHYLAPGAPAFSNICRPTPEQAIDIINSAGGIAVIAHPGRVELNKARLRELIINLASAGLGGIEAVYFTHTAYETAYFKEFAEELGLAVTGGSDTHFFGGNRAIGTPVFYLSERLRHILKI